MGRQTAHTWCTRSRRRGSAIRPTTKRRGRRIRPTRSRGSSSALGIGPGRRVCDLAAGTGKFTRLLATVRRRPRSRSNRSPGMRATFRGVLPDVPLLAGTAEAMPFRDAVARRGDRRAGVALVRPRPRRRRDGRGSSDPAAASGSSGTRATAVSPWVDAVWSIMDRVEKRAPWRDHENWRDVAPGAARASGRCSTAEFRHAQPLTPERRRAARRVGEPRRGAARRRTRGGARRGPRRWSPPTPPPGRDDRRAPVPGRLRRVSTGLSRAAVPRCATMQAMAADRSMRSRDVDPRVTAGPPAAARAPHRAPPPGHDVRPRGRRARPARRRCCCSTAGSRAAASTGSRRSSRSSEHFRVIAPDLRGHGRGLRTRAHLPARRLRRRLRGDARRARHRPGDRGRLLDGRTGRAAAVAPAPRPRRRARAVRDRARVRARSRRARLAYQTWMLGLASAARARRVRAARFPCCRSVGRDRGGCPRGSRPRCAATTGA